ncbi:MAG: peptidase T [Myxococcota bacterium]|nr:peptidase T [Myxococcota bacterium]
MRFFNDPKEILEQTTLVDRFVSYVQIDTTSNEKSEACPSTEEQWVLARKLVEELQALGLEGAAVDDNCYVTGSLPASHTDATTVVGLIAHLDTSPAAPGKNVRPVFHEKYDGSTVVLKDGVTIAPDDNPTLLECIGDTLITSDGTTLLGADDKAGVAEIMTVLSYYKDHPQLAHPAIKVGFTPDEEIGRGSDKFPIDTFGADVAFTLDGTHPGEINIETFNADSAFVTFTGVSTHPGTAKGKLVNAMRYLATFIDRLPAEVSPECTEDREGFIHPVDLDGTASKCRCHLILRDFDEDKLAALGKTVAAIARDIETEEPRVKVQVEIKRSYPNMYQFLKEKPEILEKLQEAVRQTGLKPQLVPIRGGTDGANLTRKGLPCPNIFTGGMNYHGPTEWISTRAMGLSVCTVLNLMTLYAK